MGTDSATAAKLAGLKISDRTVKGISREMIEIPPEEEGGKVTIKWKYRNPDGSILKDGERINNINSLAVPPAWSEVWFCSEEDGHIQATGKDGKGRLQYRYHPDWNKIKSDLKFAGVDEFAMSLSGLRERVAADTDINIPGMPQYKAVALVVWLMDRYHIRVGSDEYAKENESYGLTTLQEGHFELIKGKRADGKHDAIFDFTGKSGKKWRLLIKDDLIVDLIKASKAVGGEDKKQDLFRYEDDAGHDFDVKAEHINKYIREATGESYTAKNFRTWAASWKAGARLALVSEANEKEISNIPKLYKEAQEEQSDLGLGITIIWKGTRLKNPEGIVKLAENGKLPGEGEKERMATMLAIIDTVAGDLGNTRAVCRSSYIRPMFMDDWEENIFIERWKNASKIKKLPELSREESTAVHYMRTHE